MIEKFNFYDIYGYFVPGAAFLATFWIPFGLVRHTWPPTSWTDAIIAAVLAYILGHLVQSVATNAIPSWEVKGPSGRNRFPSEIYLDHTDKELPDSCKTSIQDLMRTQFGLELQVDKDGDDAIDKIRHNAFLLARQVLIQGKAVSYAEQFQGMYALTRGLVSVLALGFSYWFGFAAAAIIRNKVVVGATVLILAASLLALANISLGLLRSHPDALKKRRIDLGYAVVLLILFLAIGYAFGVHENVSTRQGAILAFISAWAVVACFRAYGAYKFFAGQFAATIWRDYLAYNASLALSQKAESQKH